MSSTLGKSVLGATLLASSLCIWPGAVQAAVIVYDQTLTTSPVAVANPSVGSFTNCLAAEGCMGNNGLVDTAGGNLPDTIPFVFSLTPSELAAVLGGSGALGTLTVVASRDIGHKTGASALDFINVTGDGVGLGSLFVNTIDSCPAGERGTDYAADLVCGANFHTDVTATDTLSLSSANIAAFVPDGTIQFIFDPTDSVGRLKIFSVELQITQTPLQVPEPSSLGLLALGIASVLLPRTRRKNTKGKFLQKSQPAGQTYFDKAGTSGMK